MTIAIRDYRRTARSRIPQPVRSVNHCPPQRLRIHWPTTRAGEHEFGDPRKRPQERDGIRRERDTVLLAGLHPCRRDHPQTLGRGLLVPVRAPEPRPSGTAVMANSSNAPSREALRLADAPEPLRKVGLRDGRMRIRLHHSSRLRQTASRFPSPPGRVVALAVPGHRRPREHCLDATARRRPTSICPAERLEAKPARPAHRPPTRACHRARGRRDPASTVSTRCAFGERARPP